MALSLKGDTGIRPVPSGVPFRDRITVDPGSAAARSGLRTGDLVDIRRLPAGDRYTWRDTWSFGRRMMVPVQRAGTTRVFTIVAGRHAPVRWSLILALAGFLWMLLFAALLAWRRSDHAEARILALTLILFSLGGIVLSESRSSWLMPE
jgi:hypothetical protein